MSIGINIYTLRKEKKITQAQLAEKLGVSEQAVSKWENEQCAPDISLFPALADNFGVSIDRIFGYHMNSYAEEVRQIMKAADDSMDTYREIEIIGECRWSTEYPLMSLSGRKRSKRRFGSARRSLIPAAI